MIPSAHAPSVLLAVTVTLAVPPAMSAVAAVAPVAGAAKLVTPPSTGSTEFLGSLLELGSGSS